MECCFKQYADSPASSISSRKMTEAASFPDSHVSVTQIILKSCSTMLSTITSALLRTGCRSKPKTSLYHIFRKLSLLKRKFVYHKKYWPQCHLTTLKHWNTISIYAEANIICIVVHVWATMPRKTVVYSTIIYILYAISAAFDSIVSV